MSAGVYIHIPFCRSRCSYCDFATDVWLNNDAVDRYVDALCKEIKTASISRSLDVDTIYLGGGTPSLLSPHQLEQVIRSVYEKVNVEPGAEVTMEMNPATVTPTTLSAFRSLGVNRASFGIQTFNDRDLKLLARGHDANDARRTLTMLRDAGFDNVSFDLIAGLPGQSLADWNANLNEAIRLSPEHISLYLLEIHQGTPLARQIRDERRPDPDPDLAAEMYECMLDRLLGEGYEQYEISNFSRLGYASRHNSKYWMLDPVYGFGVSAHSFDGRQRYANERDTAKYVQLVSNTGSAEILREDIDISSEFVFLGLRMENGITLSAYRERFGSDLTTTHGQSIKMLTEAELIALDGDNLRLTRKGKLYSNEVFAEFV